jgi:hypothetical protein
MEFDENSDSSSDCQYVDDFEYVEDLEYLEENSDFCILDIENKKIDELTKTMNNYKLRLERFAIEPLNNISELKRNIYLLCEDNRYLIDDSKFLSNLELLIYKDIFGYEDQLFMLSEQLVDTEINKEISSDKVKENHEISYDKTKENHERLIYGEKLANERKLAREKLVKEKDVENIHYLIKLENERKALAYTKQLEIENASERNYINSLSDKSKIQQLSKLESHYSKEWDVVSNTAQFYEKRPASEMSVSEIDSRIKYLQNYLKEKDEQKLKEKEMLELTTFEKFVS